jgi:DNA-binding transcriptional ArsR family regulator
MSWFNVYCVCRCRLATQRLALWLLFRGQYVMSQLEQMQAAAGEAVALLKALSHPDRLILLCQLSQGEFCVGELEENLDIHQPSLSQQLGILRQEGLVETRRDGKQMYYRIVSDNALAILQVLYSRFCPKTSEESV